MQRIEGANATCMGLFTEGPPATTVTADWLNSIQEEIAHVIEQSGFSLLNAVNDTRTQLWESIAASIRPFDYVVNSQQTFQDAIERVGANQYKIKSAYKSILFRIRTGGYSMVAAASALSSAVDSWGHLETNATSHLEFESGAYIAMGATRGYIEVNTADCYLKNVWVKGESGTAVASLAQSFLLNNVRVTFDNCKCSERNSSNDMVGFQGSGTALHNITSKYVNCSAFTFDGSGKLYGFKDCYNLNNCIAYDLDTTSGTICTGFDSCINIILSTAYQLDSASSAFGFSNSTQVSNCRAEDIDGGGNPGDYAVGFFRCYNVASCFATDIEQGGAEVVSGFWDCDRLTSCTSFTIDATGGGSSAIAFDSCTNISGCHAEDVDGVGTAYGFYNCDYISGCTATDIDSAGTANGFNSCTYVAASWTDEAANASNDWVDTVDAQITNKVSTPSIWT